MTQRNGYKDSRPHPLQDARTLAYQHGLDVHLSEEYLPGDGVAHLYIRDRGDNARVFGENLPPIRRHVLRHGESDPPEAFNNIDTGEMHNVGGGESPHNRHWADALHRAVTDLGKTPNAELTSLYKNLSGEDEE